MFRFELPPSDGGTHRGEPSTLMIGVEKGATTPYNQTYETSDIKQMSWHLLEAQLDYHYGNASDWAVSTSGSAPIITTDASGQPMLDLSAMENGVFHADQVRGTPVGADCRSMEVATNDGELGPGETHLPHMMMRANCSRIYEWSVLPAATGKLMSYTGPHRLIAATIADATSTTDLCGLLVPINIDFEMRYLADSRYRPRAVTAEYAEYSATFNEISINDRRGRAREAWVRVTDNREQYTANQWNDEVEFIMSDFPGGIVFGDFQLLSAVARMSVATHSPTGVPIYPTAIESYSVPTARSQLADFDAISIHLSFARTGVEGSCQVNATLPISALTLSILAD